jgi:hypothetical protein
VLPIVGHLHTLRRLYLHVVEKKTIEKKAEVRLYCVQRGYGKRIYNFCLESQKGGECLEDVGMDRRKLSDRLLLKKYYVC